MAERLSRPVAPVSIHICNKVNNLFKKLPTEINLQILKSASDEPSRVIKLMDQIVDTLKEPSGSCFLNQTDIHEVKAVQSAIPKLSKSGFPIPEKTLLIEPNPAPKITIEFKVASDNPFDEYCIGDNIDFDEPTKFDTSKLTSAYAKVYAEAAEKKAANLRQVNGYYAKLSEMTTDPDEAIRMRARGNGIL